jgi:hypothetical protein
MARRRCWPGLKQLCAAFLIGALIAGCSYSTEEPGLFRSDPEAVESPPELPERPWPSTLDRIVRTNSKLPVVGEEIWTSGDGLDLTVRIAIHAVRRTEGATVLDWSVTALQAPGLRVGEPVPAVVNLGLLRLDQGNTNVFLMDARGRLYRPLVHRNISRRCLCVSIYRAQRQLRIGRTVLLQMAFPELPADLTTIDVDVATVPMFSRVPVTPVGMVPLAKSPTDLMRPPPQNPRTPILGKAFSYAPAAGQRFAIRIEEVIASPNNTSVVWAIRSLSSGPGLENANELPFADPTASINYNAIAASGPLLRAGDQVLRARLVSSALTSNRTVECLCSDLRLWARALYSPGHEVSVITNFAALPEGLRNVEIVIPGVGAQRVPVTSAEDASTRSAGPQRQQVSTWDERTWLRRWGTADWPTPLPDPALLPDFTPSVDRILR